MIDKWFLKYAPEGLILYKGGVENVINKLSVALKQAMEYIDTRNIKELREKQD
ncbi:MAG: hypothetical protein QXK24_01805 [Ignisphaera sp.]